MATYNNRVLSSHLTTISSGASEVHFIEVVSVGELAGEETRQWLSKINSTVNFAQTFPPGLRSKSRDREI
jgi:hypothetical protein